MDVKENNINNYEENSSQNTYKTFSYILILYNLSKALVLVYLTDVF